MWRLIKGGEEGPRRKGSSRGGGRWWGGGVLGGSIGRWRYAHLLMQKADFGGSNAPLMSLLMSICEAKLTNIAMYV
jgi:hypothetical protein